mmetsp:Transcript_30851/g.99179  ORF Transcript_30851/g.99179 Transcript_30851/m.99179 type:complete len:200 (+) Transcript_30851:1020-1619(+)
MFEGPALHDDVGEGGEEASDLMREDAQVCPLLLLLRVCLSQAAFGMMEEGDGDLNGNRRGDRGKTRTCRGALLVQCAVASRVHRSDDVVAEVAAEVTGWDLLGVGGVCRVRNSMSHYDKRVEAKSDVDAGLRFACAEERGEPAALASVGEEEDQISVLDEIGELCDICEHLALQFLGDWVSRHGDAELESFSLHVRYDP